MTAQRLVPRYPECRVAKLGTVEGVLTAWCDCGWEGAAHDWQGHKALTEFLAVPGKFIWHPKHSVGSFTEIETRPGETLPEACKRLGFGLTTPGINLHLGGPLVSDLGWRECPCGCALSVREIEERLDKVVRGYGFGCLAYTIQRTPGCTNTRRPRRPDEVFCSESDARAVRAIFRHLGEGHAY